LQENIVRAEARLVLVADAIVGSLRDALRGRLDDEAERARALTEHAEDLRREAEAADREAATLRALLIWEQRTVNGPFQSTATRCGSPTPARRRCRRAS
jgi:hypothetical protein